MRDSGSFTSSLKSKTRSKTDKGVHAPSGATRAARRLGPSGVLGHEPYLLDEHLGSHSAGAVTAGKRLRSKPGQLQPGKLQREKGVALIGSKEIKLAVLARGKAAL